MKILNTFSPLPPLSLYIHMPWCVKKCPYCDFNSHALKNKLPEEEYIKCLVEDFKQNLSTINQREIQSIFFGGGTPSLFSAKSIENLLNQLSNLAKFRPDCEITLEANPGTVEQQRFNGFRKAGINRISLGVQSFQSNKLKLLGRIHDSDEAHRAIDAIYQAGFDNFNIDIMHGLPKQTLEDGLYDLNQAIKHSPTHISWYQLTIEPNTYFYKHTPVLPTEEVLYQIEQQGLDLLKKNNYKRYEISAYAKSSSKQDFKCQHNLNYWLFGDYLGIGAGAHSKLSQISSNNNAENKLEITRHWNYRSPYSYMESKSKFCSKMKTLGSDEKIFEFMLNNLRLFQPIEIDLFEKYTGLNKKYINQSIEIAVSKNLLKNNKNYIQTTDLGKKFLDDLCQIFLQKEAGIN